MEISWILDNSDIEKLPYFDGEIICSDGIYVWDDEKNTYKAI